MKARFLVAALLALQGCAPVATTPSAKPPELTPIDAAGDYTHAASGFAFPAELGGFRRMSLFRRGPDAKRIVAGYAAGPPECLTSVTLFVDPADRSVEADYARAKAEIQEAFGPATPDREDMIEKPSSRYAQYSLDDRRLEVIVQDAKPGWHVKQRVMYPVKCEDEVRMRVGVFLTVWESSQAARVR